MMALKKHNASPAILAQCKTLYKQTAAPSNKQVNSLPDYNSFLSARAERWGIFMMLKRYCEQKGTPKELAQAFQQIWEVSQANEDNIIFS